MKNYIALIVLVAVIAKSEQGGFTEEMKEKMMEVHMECLAEQPVDQAILAKAKEGEFVEDDAFKNHLFCFSKKVGFQDEAGKINEDKIRMKLKMVIDDEGEVESIIKKCAIEKDTPQNTAFFSLKCYKENSSQHVNFD